MQIILQFPEPAGDMTHEMRWDLRVVGHLLAILATGSIFRPVRVSQRLRSCRGRRVAKSQRIHNPNWVRQNCTVGSLKNKATIIQAPPAKNATICGR